MDSCVWGGVKTPLINAGHDVVWSGDWSTDSGDEEIMARAYEEARILLTLDKDFGELAIMRGLPHHGIVRLVNSSSRQQIQVCLHVLEHYANELQQNAIITAELHRVRIRLEPDVDNPDA